MKMISTLVLSLLIGTILFIPDISKASTEIAFNEENFTIHFDISYQHAPFYTVPVYNGDIHFTVNQINNLKVTFKNTDREARIGMLIKSFDAENNTIYFEFTRQDYTAGSQVGGVSLVQIAHVVGAGNSIVKLQSQDPTKSGPIKLIINY